MNHLTKRSFTIQGHRTSVALEPAFWAAFDTAVAKHNQTPTSLITEIDEARTTPLASAIRVWLLNQGNSSL